VESKHSRECWEKYWQKNNLLYVNKIVEILQSYIKPGCKVIEIGAGSGATSLKLVEYNADVTCLDYSSSAVKLIRNNTVNLNSKMNIVQGDAFNLPFEDNSFDICFHQGLIEHFKNPLPMIEEQKRILKNDGILLIQVPQRYSLMTIQKHILMFFGKWFAGWETEFSIRELNCLVKQTGLKPVKSAGMLRFRNLDRIQVRYLKKRFLPGFIENLYHKCAIILEDSIFGPWMAYTIVVVAKKV